MLKKRIFRGLKITLSVFALFLLLVFLLGDASGQEEAHAFSQQVVQQYKAEDFVGKLDSLNALYGKNKKLPEGYEIQALLALSHYPELKDVPIEFVLKKTLIPLASRPKVFTKLAGKPKQAYSVIISTGSTENLNKIILENLPFNAQIGVLGHELGHTIFYQDKGFFDILKIGICYLFNGYRATFERDTDKRTIAHGLGPQLYDWAKFIREQDDNNKRGEGDDFLDKYYLTPKEIAELMEQ